MFNTVFLLSSLSFFCSVSNTSVSFNDYISTVNDGLMNRNLSFFRTNEIEHIQLINNDLSINLYYVDFSLVESDKLDYLDTNMGLTQWNCSVYSIAQNGNVYSEGNCGLVSTANALRYYRRYGGYSLFPNWNSTTSFYPAQNYQWTNAARNQGYEIINNYTTLNLLYSLTRSFAHTQGYVVSGMNYNSTKLTYENLCSLYGYNGDYSSIDTNIITNVKQCINNNIPV